MHPAKNNSVSCRKRSRSGGTARWSAQPAVMAALGFTLVALLLASGCRSTGVRAVRSVSPDQVWDAVARTSQPGWFASGRRETTVTLERHEQESNPVDSLWQREPWLPVTVLRMTHRAPFPSGGDLVRMRWLTPTHLEVGYRGKTRVDYHLQNCSGVHILVEKLGQTPGDETPSHAMPNDEVHRHLR